VSGHHKLGAQARSRQEREEETSPVWREGRIVEDDTSAARATRYGDGLFATLRVADGHLLDARRQAVRLLAGAALLELDPPPGWEDPEAVVRHLLEAAAALGARDGEAVLRCQWSAAPGARGYGRGRASSARVERFPVPPSRSLRVAVLDDGEVPPPALPGVKSCSALAHVLAARAAARRTAPEAVRVFGGHVAEAVSANLFWIEAGRLRTPATDLPLYPGIVRARTIEAAGTLGLSIEEGRWSPADLGRADGAALTGSVRGVERIETLAGIELAGAPELQAVADEVARARRADATPVPPGEGEDAA
jgi:branched-subunit amino acid aminotransferase/4-amino-4-deoxychorismate lyase